MPSQVKKENNENNEQVQGKFWYTCEHCEAMPTLIFSPRAEVGKQDETVQFVLAMWVFVNDLFATSRIKNAFWSFLFYINFVCLICL